MARKKQEIALQKELNTQEEWDDMLAKEGLWVVDIYQEWCGPCKSILSHFRRIKNESGEDLLQFAVAKADAIDSLDRYRGNCKPCFLLYGTGTLVEVIRGVNPPELEKKIKNHLENELKVLKGEPGAERVEIKDPAFKHLDEAERLAKQRADEDEEDEEVEREVTVVLIKPDAKEKVDEIKQKLEERGIEILEQQERKLTEEEAKDFYRHLEEQEWFEQLIAYMTSDESIVLVISKGNSGIISEFREILGPANVEEAKENQPESLRAMFGSESFKNAIHAADSGEKAAKELEFFFPEFKIPTYKVHKAKKQKRREIEKTVALIRPDAFMEFKDEILAKISEAGFAIALQKEVQLTREQAEEFYSEKKDSPFFPELIARMTNGPVLALALAKEDAVKEWRNALGDKDPKEAKAAHPQSMRAMYSKEDIQINLLHGSDSSDSARKEMDFFFPVEQTLVVIKPDAYENRGEIIQKAKEAEFRIAARKEIQLSEEMAREFYKSHAEKEYFEELVAHMTSGKSLFLVLSRNDAVDGWRALMGDPDPTKAQEDDHSIRSIFGKDIKCNAVHGSSSRSHAAESIRLIFGDLQFDQEGKRVPGTGDLVEEDQESDEPGQSTEEEDEDGMRGPHGEIVRTDAQEAEEGERREEEGGAEGDEEDEGQQRQEGEATQEGQEEGGEQRAEGGEQPAEGGEQPVEGGEQPDEGGEKPSEGGEQPAEVSQQPAEGDDKPAEGDKKPAESGEQPAEGGEQPAEEQQQKPEGEPNAAEEKPAGESGAADEGSQQQQEEAAQQPKDEKPEVTEQKSEQPEGEQPAAATADEAKTEQQEPEQKTEQPAEPEQKTEQPAEPEQKQDGAADDKPSGETGEQQEPPKEGEEKKDDNKEEGEAQHKA